jgi:hypothetical protein
MALFGIDSDANGIYIDAYDHESFPFPLGDRSLEISAA